MKTALLCDDRFRLHDPPEAEPELPQRYDAVLDGIARAVPPERLQRLPAREATEDELAWCHTREYVRSVAEDARSGRDTLRMGDTDIVPRSYEVACLAAGAAIVAVDAVMAGRVRNAFCAVRPPGHHAGPASGEGFCIFNNAAIAARCAQRHHGLARVLIVDWDVHHGNGTQSVFEDDPTVFYFSTHQWPAYPGTGRAADTGRGAGRGFTLNCPQPRGACRKELTDAFRFKLAPAMDTFRPEFVVVSAGFDARKGDPIGNLFLDDDDFSELTRLVMSIADRHADGRLVSVLEGGYDPAGLARAAAAHVAALAGLPAPERSDSPVLTALSPPSSTPPAPSRSR